MTSTAEPAFPIIPQPLALAVDTLSRPFALRRSPTPSRAVTMSCTTDKAAHSLINNSSSSSSNNPTNSKNNTTNNNSSKSIQARAADRRRSLFHEDVFSRLLSSPLLTVFHFAFYCAIPLYYLAHHSPFSRFEATAAAADADADARGGRAADQVVRWALLLLTQYLTAMLAVSWFGRYTTRREVAAVVCMAASVTLVAGLKVVVDGVVVSRGW